MPSSASPPMAALVRVARNHNDLAFAVRRTTSSRFGHSSKATPTGTYRIASTGSKSNRQRDCAQCSSRGQPGLPVTDLSARWGTTRDLPASPQLLLLPPYGDDLERDCRNADVIPRRSPHRRQNRQIRAALQLDRPGCNTLASRFRETPPWSGPN